MKCNLLFLFVMSSCAICQVPELLWEVSYGSDNSDRGYSITAGQDSGYVIGGSCGISTPHDAFLLKLDPLGNEVWFHSYPSDLNGTCYSVIQTADGGYVFAGSDEDMPYSYLQLTKTDSDGNMEWQHFYQGDSEHTIGYSEHLIGYCVLQTEDMGFVVTGTEMGYWKSSDHAYSQRNSSGTMILLKTDSLGSEEWLSYIEWPGMDYVARGFSVIHSPDGGYIIAGSSACRGYPCGCIVKTDSLGNKEWLTYLDPEICYRLKDVMISGSNECLAVGFSSFLSSDACDLVVAKFNLQGDVLNIDTYGGDADDFASAVIPTVDGGYAITGSTWGDPPDEYLSLLLLKFNSEDELEWTAEFGEDSYYNGQDILQESNGNYTIVGYRNYLPGTYTEDAWVIQVGVQSGVSWNPSDECNAMQILSNPISLSASIQIFLNESSECKIDLFDLHGRLAQTLYSNYLTEGESILECPIQPGLPSGCYVLRMTADDQSHSAKCLILD